ncbi:MAG: hypothetical protein AB1Y26_07475 [Cycloclasticus sp.]
MCQCEPVRWSELSAAEQEKYGNGCGPRRFPRWLINWLFGWLFEASCRRHDFGYARGGSKADKTASDKGLYNAMIRDAAVLLKDRKLLQYLAALLVAVVFYLIVVALGWVRFEYGPYKTKEQILKQ